MADLRLDKLKESKINQVNKSVSTFSKSSIGTIDNDIARLSIIEALLKLDSTISIDIGGGQSIDSSNIDNITTHKDSLDITYNVIKDQINNSTTIEECNAIDITKEFVEAGFTF